MKTPLLLFSLIIFSSLGEILSARAMKQIGEISFRPKLLLKTIPKFFTNLNLIAGVVFLAISFFSFLSLLSYADLSFVVPLTAIGYITNTIGAKFLLKETISAARWMGTILVTFGVAIISLSGKFETPVLNLLEKIHDEIYHFLNPDKADFTLVFIGFFSLRIILLLLVVAALAYYFIAFVAGILWAKDRRRQRALGTNFTPPISILIPVRGADEESYETFASFCRQDYSEFQILFGCRDADDSAVPIIRKLQNEFPDSKIDLIISANEIGTNAKVSNLNNIYQHALHEYIFIVDSDIKVETDYLRRVVAPLQKSNVGMVTCLYRGARAKSFASLLENIGLSSTFGPEVMTSRMLEGVKFALGSTIALKRETLNKIGGFAAIADFLADDFWLGFLTAREGLEIIISDVVVDHVPKKETMISMLKHQLRWNKAVRLSRPKGYAGLILTYGIVTSFLLLMSLKFSSSALILFLSTIVVRLLTAVFGGVILMKDTTLLKNIWLLPIRDFIGFGVWLAGLFGNKVEWRGVKYSLTKDGKLILRRGATPEFSRGVSTHGKDAEKISRHVSDD
jgi:ceramide glucosyltransferase